MGEQELKDILAEHNEWLIDSNKGKRANLSYANLSYANLSSADLSSADLRSADLSPADLRYADLSYANLRSANLYSANLRYANLSSADLRSANLSSVKEDFLKKLAIAKAEVVGLYDFLIRGKIDGNQYEGKCACFVGSIANIRKEDHKKLGIDLRPDSGSPTEKWFLAINEGDTPHNNSVSAVTKDWMEEFMKDNGYKEKCKSKSKENY